MIDRRRLIAAWAVLAAGAALVVSACGGGGEEAASSTTALTETAGPKELQAGTITVGYGNNLTGFLAVHDSVISEGAKVEVNDINAQGGIGGKVKIDLMIEDTKTDPGVSVQVARSLVQKDVDVVILPCNTDFQVAMAEVTQASNVFTLSPCNADPTLSNRVAVYWPVGMGGNAQLAQLADYAVSKGYKSAYILNAPDFLYISLMTKYFKKAAADRGIDIAGEDTVKVGDTNFASQVTKIKNANPQPDVIMTGLFTPFVNALIKQLRGAGVDIPVIGTDGMDTGLHLQAGGKSAEGDTFSTFGFPTPGSALDEFYSTMEQETGKRPDGSYAALGAATIQVLAKAIEQAGSTDPADIQNVLADGITVDTALGQIQYLGGNEKNPTTPVAIVTVKGGKFELVKEGVPEDVPQP
jgi:branched-chain amino acid transport system substrate-binding protein